MSLHGYNTRVFICTSCGFFTEQKVEIQWAVKFNRFCPLCLEKSVGIWDFDFRDQQGEPAILAADVWSSRGWRYF